MEISLSLVNIILWIQSMRSQGRATVSLSQYQFKLPPHSFTNTLQILTSAIPAICLFKQIHSVVPKCAEDIARLPKSFLWATFLEYSNVFFHLNPTPTLKI